MGGRRKLFLAPAMQTLTLWGYKPKGERCCMQLTRAQECPSSPEPWGGGVLPPVGCSDLGARSLHLSQLRTDAFVTARSPVLHVASPSPAKVESALGCPASMAKLWRSRCLPGLSTRHFSPFYRFPFASPSFGASAEEPGGRGGVSTRPWPRLSWPVA